MGTVMTFPARRHLQEMRVDVERGCWRNGRGKYSLNNRFVIGRHGWMRHKIYVQPWSFIERWNKDAELKLDDMLEWAEGVLTDKFMIFERCDEVEVYTTVPRIIRMAFLQAAADEHLQDFLNAEVSFPCLGVAPKLTIAELVKSHNRL